MCGCMVDDPRLHPIPQPQRVGEDDRAIEALPKDALFNIIVYSESYAAWQEEMTTAKKSAKSKAHRFVDGLVANGVTNIADSLDKAFDLAGFGPPDPKSRATLWWDDAVSRSLPLCAELPA